MNFGKLAFRPVQECRDILAKPTAAAITAHHLENVYASEIDADLADTEAFCDAYDIGRDVSANCVIVQAKRADRVWYVACMILATDRVDVNSIVKKHIDARKASFAPMETATSLTQMEYGGITPIGLPDDWPILIDERILKQEYVIIGSGIRTSKILTTPTTLTTLPSAIVMNLVKK